MDKLIEKISLRNKEINKRFEFRTVLPNEADTVAKIEQICFPPNEACSVSQMKERVVV